MESRIQYLVSFARLANKEAIWFKNQNLLVEYRILKRRARLGMFRARSMWMKVKLTGE